MQLANSSNEMLDANKLFDGMEMNDIKWTAVVKKLLDEGEKGWYAWRVRMLHRTAQKYLQTSDQEINSSVESIFETKITQKNVADVRGFCDELKRSASKGEGDDISIMIL